MKYLAVLAVLAIVYVVLARHSPVAEVKDAVAQAEVAPLSEGSRGAAPQATTALKQPIDRTHAVLDQVRQRNGDGEF